MPEARIAKRPRLVVVDMLRGLVVILMILDHVRDYFHVDALVFQPTDLAQTTPILFMTRWITHLCAPTFVFLSGVSILLQRAHSNDPRGIARFVLARGLWLVAMELTLVVFGFNFSYPFVFLQVIWAIGISMILLSALLWLPQRVVLAIGVLVDAGHAALAPINAADLGAWGLLWKLLMEPGGLAPLRGFIAYPALPWFGIMAIGYGIGDVFLRDRPARNRLLFGIGAGALALFAVVRGLNGYGDEQPWSSHSSAALAAMSFINVTKYPPSLAYALVTLGVALSIAPLLEKLRGPLADLLVSVGSTPFFTYILHIYLVHGLALLVGMSSGISPSAFTGFVEDQSRLANAHWGIGLGAVYAVWIAIVLALWPLARWFAALKHRRSEGWLRYL